MIQPILSKDSMRLLSSSTFVEFFFEKELPSVIYGATKDLRSCQLILGHRSVSNTALYLGVQQEDAFEQVRKHRI